MALTFSELQSEVLRRATKDQGGTQFATAVKNIINTSIKRIAREAKWRQLRRSTTFDTETSYTTGTGAGTFTNGSKSVTVVGATFITDGIQVGRRISLSGDSTKFTIKTITGETTLTIDQNYGGTTASGDGTYTISPREDYNLPVQTNHNMFMWHEDYGSPFQMSYITEQDFIASGVTQTDTGTPNVYRTWGYDMIIQQPLEASVVTVSSSSTADTSIDITVHGIVSGYPDFEVITTNASDGTTAVAGSKSFTSVERITKGASTTGRITATSNSANVTVAVIPTGDSSIGINYTKVSLYPLPNSVFTMNVEYYKEVYDLVNTGDVHELGADFDEAIILLATSKIDYETNKLESDRFFGLFRDEIKSLKKTNVDKIDWFPTLRRGRSGRNADFFVNPFLRTSQFGSHFGPRV
jgi:hypothetical protein